MELLKEVVKTSFRNVRPPKGGETCSEAIRSQREPINIPLFDRDVVLREILRARPRGPRD